MRRRLNCFIVVIFGSIDGRTSNYNAVITTNELGLTNGGGICHQGYMQCCGKQKKINYVVICKMVEICVK